MSGELVGVEALVRWQHPERGLLPPSEFIPLAEHTTLIKPLTLYVLERALEECRRWEDDGHRLSVAVNISARNLLDAEFADAVAASLERWGLSPDRLELELTETALMGNPVRALEVLRDLGGIGVVLSIDDFGVGYTSLNQLKSLPISVLKIDRSFVLNMSHERGGRDDRALDHRPGSQPRPPGGRRGGREPGGPRGPPGAGVRHRAGLPHRASHGAGGVRAMDDMA